METSKFKTTINCGGCIASVTPLLNAIDEIQHWEVNTSTADKVLTVQTKNHLDVNIILDALKKKSFRAELIK